MTSTDPRYVTIWPETWLPFTEPKHPALIRKNDRFPSMKSDYLNINGEACGNCNGAGDISSIVADPGNWEKSLQWHPWTNTEGHDEGRLIEGSVEQAPCPVCRGGALLEFLLLHSGIRGKVLDGKQMETIQLGVPLDGQVTATDAAKSACAERPLRSWLFLYGANGSGKSHILIGMVNSARMHTKVEYLTTTAMLGKIQATYGNDARTDQVIKHYSEIPVLALDEMGAARWTEWAGEQLSNIIGERYTNDLPTWIASDVDPLTLEKQGPAAKRILSRCSRDLPNGMTGWQEVTGKDLRPRLQQALR
jgi:DNA replication protein DnaC